MLHNVNSAGLYSGKLWWGFWFGEFGVDRQMNYYYCICTYIWRWVFRSLNLNFANTNGEPFQCSLKLPTIWYSPTTLIHRNKHTKVPWSCPPSTPMSGHSPAIRFTCDMKHRCIGHLKSEWVWLQLLPESLHYHTAHWIGSLYSPLRLP